MRAIVHTDVSLPVLLSEYGTEAPRDDRTTEQVAEDIVAGLSAILGEE